MIILTKSHDLIILDFFSFVNTEVKLGKKMNHCFPLSKNRNWKVMEDQMPIPDTTG